MEKVYTGTDEYLLYEIRNLIEEFQRVKSLLNFEDYRTYISNIEALIGMYYEIYYKDPSQIREIVEERKKLNYLLGKKVIKKMMDQPPKEFIKYKDEIQNMSTKAHNDYGKMLSEIGKIQEYKEQEYTEQEYKEILIDFLKEYHEGEEQELEKLIQSHRIYNTNHLETEETFGYTIPIDNQEPIITVRSPKFTIDSLICLAHEFGHVIDMTSMDSWSTKEKDKYFYTSFYSEILSNCYQKEFINFAIKNGIDKESALKQLLRYQTHIKNVLFQTCLFSNMPNFLLKNHRYQQKDDETLIENINNKAFANLPKDFFEDIRLDSAMKYSIGGVLGSYLADVKEKDKEYGNYLIDCFMKHRTNNLKEPIEKSIRFMESDMTRILQEDIQKIKEIEKPKVYAK